MKNIIFPVTAPLVQQYIKNNNIKKKNVNSILLEKSGYCKPCITYYLYLDIHTHKLTPLHVSALTVNEGRKINDNFMTRVVECTEYAS